MVLAGIRSLEAELNSGSFDLKFNVLIASQWIYRSTSDTFYNLLESLCPMDWLPEELPDLFIYLLFYLFIFFTFRNE